MKRSISFLAGVALILAMTSGLGAAAPKPKVVIEDPVSDANFVNDQGLGDGTFGDVVTPADVSSVLDMISVSLSNDAKNLYITFETEAGPPATQGTGYRFRANPDGPGGTYCLTVEAFFPGGGNDLTESKAHVHDVCAGGDPVPAEVLGSMIVVPRSGLDALGKGATLTAPQAQGFVYLGTYPTGLAGPTADTTKPGTDYKLVDKKK
ncbi:MAG: hypothetical protein M3345_00815 [Actinomycetota bacterium]|nr:hypothetical protein [Actinomycetota bacterium]